MPKKHDILAASMRLLGMIFWLVTLLFLSLVFISKDLRRSFYHLCMSKPPFCYMWNCCRKLIYLVLSKILLHFSIIHALLTKKLRYILFLFPLYKNVYKAVNPMIVVSYPCRVSYLDGKRGQFRFILVDEQIKFWNEKWNEFGRI